jgi:hypothetical protein
MMANKKRVYYNDGQRYLLYLGANTERIIAARRFGKSDGIIAPRMLRNVQHMPRSAGAIYGATFKQILSRTLPAAIASLERLGYKQDLHYYVGRKAPKNVGFERPYINPASYDHVIHFYNGSIIHLLSQDVRFSANSLTLDYLLCDEARSVKKEKMFEEVIPAVSGYIGKFDSCPWHKGTTFVSDMPTNKAGEWLLLEEKNMNREVINTLEGTIAEIRKLEKGESTYAEREIKQQIKERDFLRRIAFIYKEFDAVENLELLGEEYFNTMRRNLTPLIFLTSIMNKRITRLENGFYANLDEKLHYYDAFNTGYLNELRTDRGSFDIKKVRKESSLQDDDVDNLSPLSIAFDYNANINWVVTGQQRDGKLLTLKSMYVKNKRKIRELCKDWSEYYRHHKCREVHYYYDSTAKHKAYAVNEDRFCDVVVYTLEKMGWDVTRVDIGTPRKHAVKHQIINDALTGAKYLFPMFNRENNFELLLAMEQTDIRVGRNGFEKDKSGEKLDETDEDPLELRTDGTDAWDTLFLGITFHTPGTGGRTFPIEIS